MKQIVSLYSEPQTIYHEGEYKITMTKQAINDLVSKKAFNVFCFKLYKSGVFVCLTNIAADPHKELDIKSCHPGTIEILKKYMV